MPRLPDGGGVRQTPRARISVISDRSGEIRANALQDAGRTLVRTGEEIEVNNARRAAEAEQRQENEDRLAIAKGRAAVLRAQTDFANETVGDSDFDTLEQRYRERMSKVRDEATKGIRTPSASAQFSENAAIDVEQGVLAIRQRAFNAKVDRGRADIEEIETSSRTAALDAQNETARAAVIANVREALQAGVDAGYLTAEESTKRMQSWTHSYAVGQLETLEPTERIRRLKNPNGNAAHFLDADERTRMIREAEAEAKTSLTEARQAMDDRLRDIFAAAQVGVPIENVPDKAVLTALYGAREGEQRHRAATTAASLSETVAGLHTLSRAELVAAGARGEFGPAKQVQGAAEQAQVNAIMTNKVEEILRARATDPAGYLTQFSPAVRDEWEAFSEDPSQGPAAYIRALRAERERLGIPGDEVLPEAYAASVANAVNTSSAGQLATTFETLGTQWGEAWPQVYRQIAKDVPGAALVIGSGIPRAAATALASTMTLKDNELKAMLPPQTTWNDVETEVSGQFSDLRASLPAEAGRTMFAVTDAATRLAVKYMNEGSGLADAVQKAHRDLVESQYTMLEMRGSTVRVPSGVDVRQVETVARARLATFGEGDEDQASISVPDGSTLAPEEYVDRWRDYVRDNGYWQTNPQSTGIRLYVDGGPVAGPIEMTWDQLLAPGVAAAAQRMERQRKAATASLDSDGTRLSPMHLPRAQTPPKTRAAPRSATAVSGIIDRSAGK